MDGSASVEGSASGARVAASASAAAAAAGSASSVAWSASSWGVGVSSSGKAATTSPSPSHQEAPAFTWGSMASSTEALGLYYSSSEWWPRLACVAAAAMPTSSSPTSPTAGRSSASSPAAVCGCSPVTVVTRSGPCFARRAAKRRCTADCELAIYFPAHGHEREVFDVTHKLFGAQRMATALRKMLPERKEWYVRSRIAEAYARALDPVLGLKGILIAMQAELRALEEQLASPLRMKDLAVAGIPFPSPATAAPPAMASPSRQTCPACAHARRVCAPCCPLAQLFPTADLYCRACEMFGSDGVDRLAEILSSSMDGETPHKHQVGVTDPPVHGAVALVRALLGGHDAGVHSDATAFLHWMLRKPVAQAAPSPTSTTTTQSTLARGSRSGACRVVRGTTKCTDTCVFAPYFPAAKADQYILVCQVFGTNYIRDMLQVQDRNNKVPRKRLEECVVSLVQMAQELKKGSVSGCLLSISLLMRKLLEARQQLTANALHKRDGDSSPPAVTSADNRGVRKEASSSTSYRDGVPQKKARLD